MYCEIKNVHMFHLMLIMASGALLCETRNTMGKDQTSGLKVMDLSPFLANKCPRGKKCPLFASRAETIYLERME